MSSLSKKFSAIILGTAGLISGCGSSNSHEKEPEPIKYERLTCHSGESLIFDFVGESQQVYTYEGQTNVYKEDGNTLLFETTGTCIHSYLGTKKPENFTPIHKLP